MCGVVAVASCAVETKIVLLLCHMMMRIICCAVQDMFVPEDMGCLRDCAPPQAAVLRRAVGSVVGVRIRVRLGVTSTIIGSIE